MKTLPTVGFGLLFSLWSLSGFAQSAASSKTAIVRAYEVNGSQNLIISYGNGKKEYAKMEGILGRKNQEEVTDQLQAVVERFYNEGYHLVGTASGGLPNGIITTFVFRRE